MKYGHNKFKKEVFMIFPKNNIIFISFLLFSVQVHTALRLRSEQPENNNPLSLLTWNVLGPQAPDLSEHFPNAQHFSQGLWEKSRLPKIQRIINELNPSIICLQEVSPEMVDGLNPSNPFRLHLQVPGHEYFYHVASACSKGRFGGAVVLYDRSKLQLLGSENCFLSDGNYDKAGAVAWAIFDLVGQSQQFKRELKNLLIIGSVHFSRANDRSQSAQGQAQMNSLLGCLYKFLAESGIDPQKNGIVIAGDFNTFYEEVANNFMKMPGVQDLGLKMFEHKLLTVSRKKNGQHEFASIDHILYTPLVETKTKAIFPEYQDEIVAQATDFITKSSTAVFSDNGPSDHLALFMQFQLQSYGEPQQLLHNRRQFNRNPNSAYEKIVQNWFVHFESLKPEVEKLFAQGIKHWIFIFDKLSLDEKIRQYILEKRDHCIHLKQMINKMIEEIKKEQQKNLI